MNFFSRLFCLPDKILFNFDGTPTSSFALLSRASEHSSLSLTRHATHPCTPKHHAHDEPKPPLHSLTECVPPSPPSLLPSSPSPTTPDTTSRTAHPFIHYCTVLFAEKNNNNNNNAKTGG